MHASTVMNSCWSIDVKSISSCDRMAWIISLIILWDPRVDDDNRKTSSSC